jgi:hypothetical protein
MEGIHDMAGKRMTFISWFLLLLSVAFFGLIWVFVDWGGRIESALVVFRKPVFVELDGARPRIWLLFSLPALLLAGAISARKPR